MADEKKKPAPLIPHPVPKFGRPFCTKCHGHGGTVEKACGYCGGDGYRPY